MQNTVYTQEEIEQIKKILYVRENKDCTVFGVQIPNDTIEIRGDKIIIKVFSCDYDDLELSALDSLNLSVVGIRLSFDDKNKRSALWLTLCSK